MKKILAVILSLGAAYIVLNVTWWILVKLFSLAFTVITIMAVGILTAVIAVPIYLIIRRKLLS
jgi:hypothetical protein